MEKNIYFITDSAQQLESVRTKLIEMGIKDCTWGGSKYNILYVQFDVYGIGVVASYTRHIVEYDPKSTKIENIDLFYALAATYNDEEHGVPGQYWKYKGDSYEWFTHGNLYKARHSINQLSAFYDNVNAVNGFMFDNHTKFIKATREEIVKHFHKSPNPIPNKKICFKGNSNNELANKIILELVNLGGNNRSSLAGSCELFYYFIGPNNYINGSNTIPEGYTLQTIVETQQKMENKTINATQAQQIIDIACNTWKPSLARKWSNAIVLKQDIEIPESEYKEMRKACTAYQHVLFDQIFGKDQEKFNATMLRVGEFMKMEQGGNVVVRIYGNLLVEPNNWGATWDVENHITGEKLNNVNVKVNIK